MQGLSGRFLHIGCGPMHEGTDSLPSWAKGCIETRLDIDPNARPDIVASMVDLGNIGVFDIVYSCHALEHLYPHEVPIALSEQYRVLRDGGGVMCIVPDLEGVEATEEPIYNSISGPICGLDMIYGKASFIQNSIYMAHHSGFVSSTIKKALEEAGFVKVTTTRHKNSIICGGLKHVRAA
jgi:SAM-dependent methyltransferase